MPAGDAHSNERTAASNAASRKLGRQNPVLWSYRRGRHDRSRAGRAVRRDWASDAGEGARAADLASDVAHAPQGAPPRLDKSAGLQEESWRALTGL